MAPVTKKEISNRRKLLYFFSFFSPFFLSFFFFFFLLFLGLTISNYPEIFTNLFLSQTILPILLASPAYLIQFPS